MPGNYLPMYSTDRPGRAPLGLPHMPELHHELAIEATTCGRCGRTQSGRTQSGRAQMYEVDEGRCRRAQMWTAGHGRPRGSKLGSSAMGIPKRSAVQGVDAGGPWTAQGVEVGDARCSVAASAAPGSKEQRHNAHLGTSYSVHVRSVVSRAMTSTCARRSMCWLTPPAPAQPPGEAQGGWKRARKSKRAGPAPCSQRTPSAQ